MDIRIIRSPSKECKAIIRSRIPKDKIDGLSDFDTIGLVQGRMIDMLCAADIAEKTTGVTVCDVRGVCPQHMTLIAIFGDTASVKEALSEIGDRLKEGENSDYSKINR